MSSPLTIFLHCDGQPGQEVTVDATDTVETLERFLPDGLKHILYHDEVEISPAFTLGFLGVKNGDHILAISRRKEKRASKKPARKLKEAPVEVRRKMVNDRLHDQFFNHIEGTSVSYRRVLSCFFNGRKNAEQKKEKSRQREKTTIPAAPDRPFTEAMPNPW